MRSATRKLDKARFDGAYMFAAVFASIGGILLLGSYAASRPIDTFSQGNYSLANYATTQPGVYILGLSSKLNYCLSPMTSGFSTDIKLVDVGMNESVTLNTATDDTVCFRSVSSYDKAELKIQPTPPSGAILRVL